MYETAYYTIPIAMYLPLVISTRADSVPSLDGSESAGLALSPRQRPPDPPLKRSKSSHPLYLSLPFPSRHVRRRHPPFARGRRGRRVPRVPRRGGSSPPQAPAESGARLASPPRGRGAAGAPPPRLRRGGEAAGTVQARAR